MSTFGTTVRRDAFSALRPHRRAVNALATGQLQHLTVPLRQGWKPAGRRQVYLTPFTTARYRR